MRLSSVCLALVVAAVALGVSAEPASAAPGPCDFVGVPFVPDPAEKVCEKVTGAAGDVAMDVAGDAANAIAAPIFRQATQWVADGAGWLVGRVGALIDTTTTPRLDSQWFTGQYRQMGLLATALALPLLFLAVMQTALSRNPAVITRALAAVPTAFVLTGAAVAIIAALLGITDWACQVISRQTGPQGREFFHDVAAAFGELTDSGGAGGAGVALFVAFLASMFAALGAFAVWVELLIRSAGIYVCVLFFPTVLVARIWPRLEKWATRLAEGLTALILSKFVIVATLSLAAGAMAESRAGEGFNGVLAGGALLIFAAFAPLVLFRLVQFAEVQVHARAGTAGTAARSAQTTMSAAQAARIAMDRQAAGGGVRSASAADMARSTTTAAGGGSRSAPAPSASRPSAGGARGGDGGSPTTSATPSGSARGLGDDPPPHTGGGRHAQAGRGTKPVETATAPTRGPSATGAESRRPDSSTSDRRPLDDTQRHEPHTGGQEGGGQ
jgi:type IV secretion system protein TrbL